MSRKKLLVVFPLILSLILAGYILVKNVVTAQEATPTPTPTATPTPLPTEDDEEIRDIEKLFDRFTNRLEKTELKLDKAPMSMAITSQKKATFINVNLEAISGTNLTVKIFGLTFTVDASGAKIYGGGKEMTISDLKVGNKLLIKGIVDETTGVIKATRIHDRSFHSTTITNIRARIQELLKQIEELRAKLRF